MIQLKKPRSKQLLVPENGEKPGGLKREDSKQKLRVLKAEDSKLKLLQAKESATNVQLIHYENSYRMEPSGSKFFTGRVSNIIHGILEEELKTRSYNFPTFSQLTMELSDRIKKKVTAELDMPNHKLVSFVTIDQLKGQGVHVASRCLWHPTWDNYASACYKNHSLFAVGVVYAVYVE